MKKLIGIFFIGCLGLFACNNGTNTEDSVDSAKDMNDSMMSNNDNGMNSMSATPVSEDDADWAVEAANGGMTEVEASKIAQTKATDQSVKDFASMMVMDHTKANDQLKQLAATKSITLPASLSDKSQKDMDDLNKKSGKDFDKAYVNLMVDDHKKDVDKFKNGIDDLKDADLKSFASQTLPVIQKHLDAIQAIDNKK